MGRHADPITDPLAVAYLTWCTQQGQPVHTIRRRRAVLRSVATPGTITREDLEAWWATRTHLAAVSRANELAVLRAFYRWCQVWEHRADNPAVRLAQPGVGKGAPRPATRRELEQILRHVTDRPPLRRAVLLGAWAGLRVSEAAALRWVDVDVDALTARVTGKGNKTRTVALSQRLIDELLPDTGGNVVTGAARGWTGGTLGKKVNAAMRDAGVDVTFHKLRHRYGTLGYQRQLDPRALADLMGHGSVAVTMEFYAAASSQSARAIADAVVDD